MSPRHQHLHEISFPRRILISFQVTQHELSKVENSELNETSFRIPASSFNQLSPIINQFSKIGARTAHCLNNRSSEILMNVT